MENKDLVSTDEICSHYQVAFSFLDELQQHELIAMSYVEQVSYVALERLPHLERLIRLHHDLDINVEGLEAVSHLLDQIETMQHRIRLLENKLHLYED